MKRNLLASLLALCAIAGQAQGTQNSNSAPLDSVIIEGVVTNIPEGTCFQILYKEKEDKYLKKYQDVVVKKEMFRFAILPKKKEELYYLAYSDNLLQIYVEPGLKKIRVTGNGACAPHYWYVESENFEQQEINAYNQFVKENLSDYYELTNKESLASMRRFDTSLTQEERDKAAQEFRELFPMVVELKKEKYNAAMIDYLKDRPFSKLMAAELYFILLINKNQTIVEKAHEIFKKYPQEAMDEQYVAETKTLLNADKAKIGHQLKDFTLFDRKGNKHQLSEFKGKYTILEFTYVGCVACQLVKPVLDDFYKRNKDKVEVVAIYYDTEKDWMAEGEKHKVSFHEWNDHARSAEPVAAYGVRAYPTFVIIDPNGKILDIKESASGFYEIIKKYIPDAEVEKKLENARNS